MGLLHQKKRPDYVPYAKQFAKEATRLGIDLLYFNPNKINWDEAKITGYHLVGDKWQQVISKFPDVIYEPITQKAYSQDLLQLKQNLPFISHKVGSEMCIFKKFFLRYQEFDTNKLIESRNDNIKKSKVMTYKSSRSLPSEAHLFYLQVKQVEGIWLITDISPYQFYKRQYTIDFKTIPNPLPVSLMTQINLNLNNTFMCKIDDIIIDGDENLAYSDRAYYLDCFLNHGICTVEYTLVEQVINEAIRLVGFTGK